MRTFPRSVLVLLPYLLVLPTVDAQQSPTPLPSPKRVAAALAPGESLVPLDPWLTSPTLWQTAPDQFPAARAFRFRWVSNTHDAARTDFPALRLHDLPVAEVIARFSPGNAVTPVASPGIAPAPATMAAAAGHTQLAGLQISIYNRGDVGDLDQKSFDALVTQSKGALDALTGVPAAERGADNGSAVQSRGLVWLTPQSRYLLEWSATPENKVQGIAYRAEFIRLKITPVHDQPKTFLDQLRTASNATAGAARPATVHASELPARLVKDPDGGERLPNIPMVDQGQKGYCVTAATERVLRYYGVDVDQNELAQIANTETDGGTSTEAMLAALKKLASRFKVNVITEVNPTYADFVQEISDYNRVARNAPKAAGATLVDTRTTPLSYEMAFSQMKGDLLRDARTKLNPAYMTRFEHDIQARLERGIPLLWSVELGMLPEEKLNLQTRGGHMRLIIGYNAKTREVYYSDTWGMGHELKKMPLADAWTITTGLFSLEPI